MFHCSKAHHAQSGCPLGPSLTKGLPSSDLNGSEAAQDRKSANGNGDLVDPANTPNFTLPYPINNTNSSQLPDPVNPTNSSYLPNCLPDPVNPTNSSQLPAYPPDPFNTNNTQNSNTSAVTDPLTTPAINLTGTTTPVKTTTGTSSS
ncbi:hypothetical protein CROQUDRAFT_331497 [Cronartium quercuum f. sp. fusiforme G11]|uniref:Uncharacterized protein n=1 Tax=Cronartium quercuum f. sp. fusiforme G11 TaxID=708437 RepID=A0A9P6TED3_9BASI|nr:hypothetical protein CROQUDRAFT_331497 [Cronartium quercuum f. sp. fusiforme G11]